MIEVTSRRMECTLLTSNYSQMPAVALHLYLKKNNFEVGAFLDFKYAKSFRGGPKFRQNCVTSQINFMGSAKSTTILGWLGACPGKIFQITAKNTHFHAFWNQV